MKPNDGRRGFIFDSDKPKGIVVAVDKERLLEKMKTMKADHHINRQQVRACAKAFRANNDLHLMASFYVNEEGDICLLEGRHRLELLRQGSESMILINLFDHQESRVLDFSKQIDIVFETCGAEGASIVKNQPVVFCNVDFEESGHTPYIFEERVREPYYTVA
ncbi:MAG: hypothetical protein LRZ85_06385 [Alphaproteobacteria bacterium]|nr:hypothetical protein [Alphaproteobacteria bacterium]